MTRTRAWLLVGIVLVAGAYMAGYWPERQRAQEVREQAAALETRAADLEARVRLGEVLGLLLRLDDAVTARNYGEASDQATRYFDRVAGEMGAAGQAAALPVLQTIHQTRDRVIASLARTEPMVIETLREQEHALRRALGYPVPERVPPPASAMPAATDGPAPPSAPPEVR